MGMLAEKIVNFFYRNPKNNSDERNSFVFYKIVDSIFVDKEERYKIQCINTKAVFQAGIEEIILDIDILHSLHPIQACYIGIEYAKRSAKKKSIQNISAKTQTQAFINKHSIFRYGSYCLTLQDRKGNVCFMDKNTKKEFLMDPRDIALSKELIEEFDAAQAFYIGLLAGFKLNNPTKEEKNIEPIVKRPHLCLINGGKK